MQQQKQQEAAPVAAAPASAGPGAAASAAHSATTVGSPPTQGAMSASMTTSMTGARPGSSITAGSAPVPKEGFFNVFFGKDQGNSTHKTAASAAAAVQASATANQQANRAAAAAAPAPGKPAPVTSAPAPSSGSTRGAGSQSGGGGGGGLGSGRADRMEQVPASIKSLNAPSDKERFETELISSLLVAYFDIVRKNVKVKLDLSFSMLFPPLLPYFPPTSVSRYSFGLSSWLSLSGPGP
jgi:hypothetical protein